MEAFEPLWAEHRPAIERYVHFHINNPADAEDVLQEVLSAAVAGFAGLHKPGRFKPWLIGIARNKCADFLCHKYKRGEVPLIHADRIAVMPTRFARVRDNLVLDTLEKLPPQDQEILRMCYWQELPQQEIARQLQIPLGTVKSRLHICAPAPRCY